MPVDVQGSGPPVAPPAGRTLTLTGLAQTQMVENKPGTTPLAYSVTTTGITRGATVHVSAKVNGLMQGVGWCPSRTKEWQKAGGDTKPHVCLVEHMMPMMHD